MQTWRNKAFSSSFIGKLAKKRQKRETETKTASSMRSVLFSLKMTPKKNIFKKENKKSLKLSRNKNSFFLSDDFYM